MVLYFPTFISLRKDSETRPIMNGFKKKYVLFRYPF